MNSDVHRRSSDPEDSPTSVVPAGGEVPLADPASHRRRNWFVGVFALTPRQKEATVLAGANVRFETFRAGGPGGQHQNTTDSAVRATHLPTGISVVSRDQRSQHRNKDVALDRLAAQLVLRHSLDTAKARNSENQLHRELERGNPVRSFK